MNSREIILNSIQGAESTLIHLPKPHKNKAGADEVFSKFIENLKTAGAEVVVLAQGVNAADYTSKNFMELIDFDSADNWKKYGQDCPLTELNKIETVCITGLIAVAENGAIWVDNTCFPNQIIPFITQQLILKINTENIVPTMHEAYQQISFKELMYGVFIAGPSKTADIEQSLVIGAHGPKALTVIIETANDIK